MTANEIEIRVSVRSDADKGLAAAERRAKDTGNSIARSLAQAGEKAGEGFNRGLDSKLGSGGGEGRSVIGRMIGGLAEQAANAADAVAQSLSKIPAAVGSAAASAGSAGPYGLLAAVLLGVAAAAAAAYAGFIALAPAVAIAGGAFGAATTAGFGLAAVVGTLAVGLGGLSDAWTAAGQKSSGGGRSAADAAYQVRQATLALADAQRAALQAQEALTRARKDEQERQEDLSRSLAGARLDEEGAVLAVQRAEQRLREARRGGKRLDIAEAELAYRQSLQTLDEVRDRVGDLSTEQQEANKKGIEGSDQVQQALRQQEQAQRSIQAATHALAQAQRGAGGGVDRFAEAMANLSPNGQKLIRTLLDLKPRWDELRRATQDRLLAGLDVTIERLASRSLPTLQTILGRTADSLNGLFKGAAGAAGDKTFLANATTASDGFNRWLDRLGATTVPKLMDSLGRLAASATPFLEEVGDLVSDVVEGFSDWIAEADKSGKLDSFMKDAAKALRDVKDIGREVVGIAGELFEILFPGSKREADGWLGGTKEILKDVREWLGDEDNQRQIQGWITKIQDFRDTVIEWGQRIGEWIDTVDKWKGKIDGFVSTISKLPGRIKTASKGMFDGIKDAFRTAFNWIIDRWNGLSFTLPGFTAFGQQIGGGTVGTPDIPRFDHGGIVGGGLVRLAERARETVSTPNDGLLAALPGGSMVHTGAAAAAMGGGAPTNVTLNITLGGGGAGDLDRALMQWIRKNVRINGGGDVQNAFGKYRGTAQGR